MANVENVIILGSGPAGLTAALYTARANLNPLVITGHELGGQIATTTDVENFPGFPEGLTGPELTELMQKQAERFGARFEFDSITSVDFAGRPFRTAPPATGFSSAAKSWLWWAAATARCKKGCSSPSSHRECRLSTAAIACAQARS